MSIYISIRMNEPKLRRVLAKNKNNERREVLVLGCFAAFVFGNCNHKINLDCTVENGSTSFPRVGRLFQGCNMYRCKEGINVDSYRNKKR